MNVIVLLILAALVAGVFIANAVFSPAPRRRRRPGPGPGEGPPPAGSPVPAVPLGPRGSLGDEEPPPFDATAEDWDQEAPPHLPYPGERPSWRRPDSRSNDGSDSGDGDSDGDSGGGDDD